MNLLGTTDDLKNADGVSSVLNGPPQTVALIESGATAAAKWWATGGAAVVAAAWVKLYSWWGSQPGHIQDVALWGIAIITSAVALAIAYLLATDIRSRAAAAVATVNARALIGQWMISSAGQAYHGAAVVPAAQAAPAKSEIYPLPSPLSVTNTSKPGPDEPGWTAVALLRDDTGFKYLVGKGAETAILAENQIQFP